MRLRPRGRHLLNRQDQASWGTELLAEQLANSLNSRSMALRYAAISHHCWFSPMVPTTSPFPAFVFSEMEVSPWSPTIRTANPYGFQGS